MTDSTIDNDNNDSTDSQSNGENTTNTDRNESPTLEDVETALDTFKQIQDSDEAYLTEDEQGVLREGKQRIEHLRDDSPEVFDGLDSTAGKPVAHQNDPDMVTYGVIEYLRDECETIDDELMNSLHVVVQNAAASGFDQFA